MEASGRRPSGASGAPPAFLYHGFDAESTFTTPNRGVHQIREGCDHPCTFCISPQLRGRFAACRFESVVREAENLAESGRAGDHPDRAGHDFLRRRSRMRDGLRSCLKTGEMTICVGSILYAYRIAHAEIMDTIAAHPRLGNLDSAAPASATCWRA